MQMHESTWDVWLENGQLKYNRRVCEVSTAAHIIVHRMRMCGTSLGTFVGL